MAWPCGGARDRLAYEADTPTTHLETPGRSTGERFERALTHAFDGRPILAFVGDAAELPADAGADLLCSLILYDAAFCVSPSGRGVALALRVLPPGIGRVLGDAECVDGDRLAAFLRWLGLSVATVDAAAPADQAQLQPVSSSLLKP